MSDKPTLDRVIKAVYGGHQYLRPKTIRLTVEQANQIQDEMVGYNGRPRMVISRDMDMRFLSRPVEWVDTEDESILS